MINIPDVLKFSYFTRVWYDLTPYIDGTQALSIARIRAANYIRFLNSYYKQNPTIPFDQRRRTLMFDADLVGNWGVIVEDPDLPVALDPQGNLVKKPVRHTTKGEHIAMTIEELNSNLGFTPENVHNAICYISRNGACDAIQNKTQLFNRIIAQKVADSNGRFSLIDYYDYFEQMFDDYSLLLERKGRRLQVDGAPFLPIMGGLGVFSADGINFNPRGNALLTNVIIDKVNAAFNGNLSEANPNENCRHTSVNAN